MFGTITINLLQYRVLQSPRQIDILFVLSWFAFVVGSVGTHSSHWLRLRPQQGIVVIARPMAKVKMAFD